MERRHIDAADRVIGQLERRHFQLAADRHQRTFAGDPPAVELIGLRLDRFVNSRVEHDDVLPVDENCVGYDDPVLEEAHEALGEARLAGSRGAVEEDRMLRVERRPELVEHLRLDDEIAHRLHHLVPIDLEARLLELHRGDVGVERDRSDAHVLRFQVELPGEFPAEIGQAEDVVVALHRLHIDQLARAACLEHLIEDRTADPQPADELGDADRVLLKGLAEEQFRHHGDGDVQPVRC